MEDLVNTHEQRISHLEAELCEQENQARIKTSEI